MWLADEANADSFDDSNAFADRHTYADSDTYAKSISADTLRSVGRSD